MTDIKLTRNDDVVISLLKNDKQAVLKMERNIFGRPLSIAIDKKVDAPQCLT